MAKVDMKHRFKQVMKVATELERATSMAPGRLLVVGAGAAAERLGAQFTRAAFDGAAPAGPARAAVVDVMTPAAVSGAASDRWVAAVILAQAGPAAVDVASLVRQLREDGVTLVALAAATPARLPAALAAPPADVTVWLREAGFHANEIVYQRPRGHAVVDLVARCLAAQLGDNGLALAARLPLMRAAVVKHIIDTTARQNGLVGAVVFIPGADMPVMTLNQVRMVLRIAAAYGEDVGSQRALEILSVVGAGFGFRALGRQALDVVPLAGWVVKGALGYGATVSLGKATVRYFEAGAPLAPEQARKITEKIDTFTRGSIGKRLVSSG
ncbi:MAG: DUF697 domain-containing protein [Thermoleophilia bacterium]